MRLVILLAFGLMASTSLHAQEVIEPIKLGFLVGSPLVDTTIVNSSSAPPLHDQPRYSTHTPRWVAGVSGEVQLTSFLTFAANGLIRRIGFESSIYCPCRHLTYFRPTSANVWEIPGLFKIRLPGRRLRTYVDIGSSYRHVSTIKEMTYTRWDPAGVINDHSSALHHRNTFGGVVGFGFVLKPIGPVSLAPEFRYSRWASELFRGVANQGLRTNLDQADFLLGVQF